VVGGSAVAWSSTAVDDNATKHISWLWLQQVARQAQLCQRLKTRHRVALSRPGLIHVAAAMLHPPPYHSHGALVAPSRCLPVCCELMNHLPLCQMWRYEGSNTLAHDLRRRTP